MVYLTKKKIRGREYSYLVKSLRLPNGKVVKISKKVNEQNLNFLEKKYSSFFEEKEKELLLNFALNNYSLDSVFNKEAFRFIEESKFEYKKILKRLSKNQLKDLFDRFTANFCYESNAIEGNSLTLKDVTLVLFEGASVKNKSLREIYEAKNTREAVDLMIKGKIKLNERGIIKLHEILVKDTGVNFGYKKVPNFLVGRKVKTTPPEKVEEEMNKLIEWYHSSRELHPLVKSALFHGFFEKVHPFEDGNGRVGRILSNVILLENGYAPIIVRKTSRMSYFNALEAFDYGYKLKLERFFLNKYKQTFKNFFQVYLKYI